MPATEPCPVGCGRARRDGHLMCGSCWRRVPASAQREVYRSWRAWNKDLADPELARAYRAAADNAEHWAGRPVRQSA